MRQIPKQVPDGATKLTPLDMNAIHFGGLQSPITPAPDNTTAPQADSVSR